MAVVQVDGTASLFVGKPERLIRERVVDVLRDAIFRNQLPPGYALVDRQLGELTGVSRTSIREALRQLETEGLVGKRPGGGLRVVPLTHELVNNLFEVRATLEPSAVALFIDRASEKDFEVLAGIPFADRDPEVCIEAIDRYYKGLMNGIKNPVFNQMFGSIMSRLRVLRRLSLQANNRLEKSQRELHGILTAIAKKDAEAAIDLTRKHVFEARSAALQCLSATAVQPPHQ